jgi:outer membrane lipoprotein SlyB
LRRNHLLVSLLLCAGLSATDTLTTTDGSQHNGTLVSATSTTITFRERKTLHHYPKSSVQSIEMNTGTDGSPALSRRQADGSRNNVELPAGTEIAVLANQTIDSSTATEGQIFPADVAENVMDASGRVVIPKGSLAELVLRSASRGGLTSNAEIALDLQSIKVGNRRYLVNTADLEQKAQGGVGANKRTAEMVGGGAVLGTLIGAIAGGGKGAAIGAVAGAGAGAGTQVLTRGKTVKVPAETTLRFKLDQPLTLQAAY